MEKDPQTHGIIGAAMEVHRQLGDGFLEAVYQAALAMEFSERGMPFQGEVELAVYYKGRRLPCDYRADFICFESVVVETKAISALTAVCQAQLLNELKATSIDVEFSLTSEPRAWNTDAWFSEQRKICANL